LIKEGRVIRGYLGINPQTLTPELAGLFGLPEDAAGVLVAEVGDKTPAQKAGVMEGDVITEINRKHVSTPRQFSDAVIAADLKRGVMVNLISEGGSRFVVLKDSRENSK